MKRKPKSNANEEINNLTWKWFVSARAKNIPISGPIIQTKARQIAEQMSVTEFKASNSWSESFKNRHNIVWHKIYGYEPKNIYSGDETGLFFRALPSKTLSGKSEECKVVIGKAQKPRCFKNLDSTKFPIIWRANNKA
ncbi:tigger transposable element-derived protein 4-like isoform X2 [Sipha flava]|uniref:Tigger transposable element-derived protein 4-like isoform X2 n=1 Tax=Sipha flava TaxID=143950 RepID=A0A8B8GC48_9HEMI|nr:tigger transposable element-derived protein 4-like isoform X2 [Sipha flava]